MTAIADLLWFLSGILLIVLGCCWSAFWYVAASMTTPTGQITYATWIAFAICALGLLPSGWGIWIITRVL